VLRRCFTVRVAEFHLWLSTTNEIVKIATDERVPQLSAGKHLLSLCQMVEQYPTRVKQRNMLCSYVSNPASNLPNLLIPFENILVNAEITTWTIRKLMNLRDCASNCGALKIYLRKLNHKVKKRQRKIYCPEHGPKYAFPPSRIELL
jgi:hypothetical protein